MTNVGHGVIGFPEKDTNDRHAVLLHLIYSTTLLKELPILSQ